MNTYEKNFKDLVESELNSACSSNSILSKLKDLVKIVTGTVMESCSREEEFCCDNQRDALNFLAKQTVCFIKENPEAGEPLLSGLWSSSSISEQIIAANAVSSLFDIDEDCAFKLILHWIPDLNNIEVCDELALVGVQPYARDNPLIFDRLVRSWVKSPSPWIRRFGLTSSIPGARNDKDVEIDRYFNVLKYVMTDTDETVKNGAAWFIREITSRDIERMTDFLNLYAEEKNPHSAEIIVRASTALPREVRESLKITVTPERV